MGFDGVWCLFNGASAQKQTQNTKKSTPVNDFSKNIDGFGCKSLTLQLGR